MTIHVSTVQLDHMPSNESEILLVGRNYRPDFGEIKASSYFRLMLENTNNNFPDNAQFDSLNLIIKPHKSKYFYGDTTVNQKIFVHRLTQELIPTNLSSSPSNYEIPIYVQGPSFFADQTFDYDSTPLGELDFQPSISKIDSLNIRLNQQLGEELYSMIQNNDHRLSTVESFQEYLKGMVLVPDENNTNVLGFSDTLQLRINYSYIDSDGFRKTDSKNIIMGDRRYQFNNLSYDRTGTSFEELGSTVKELKSANTNGDALIHAGIGTVAKIQIPSLNEFMQTEGITVNKAELIVETEADIKSIYPAPEALMLFVANANNNPISFISYPFVGSNNIQYGPYISGNTTGKKASYKFDLIEYLKTINDPANSGNSLMLSAALPILFNSTNSMLIAKENGIPKIKLNIVYTKFQ